MHRLLESNKSYVDGLHRRLRACADDYETAMLLNAKLSLELKQARDEVDRPSRSLEGELRRDAYVRELQSHLDDEVRNRMSLQEDVRLLRVYTTRLSAAAEANETRLWQIIDDLQSAVDVAAESRAERAGDIQP